MEKVFCDICGKEFQSADMQSIEIPQETRLAMTGCPSVVDVCPSCMESAKDIKVETMILGKWKKAAKNLATRKKWEQPALETLTESTTEPTRKKKRELFDRLRDYRAKNGLGCLQPIAEISGVSTDVLRSMLLSFPPPNDAWSKIEAALNAVESGDVKIGGNEL